MSGCYCGQSGSQFCDCCSFYDRCHEYDKDVIKKEPNLIKATSEMYEEYTQKQEELRKQLCKIFKND